MSLRGKWRVVFRQGFRIRRTSQALMFLFSILSFNKAFSQAVIYGKTNPWSTVSLLNSNIGIQADSKGDFSISLSQSGSFTIVISAIGFETYKETFNLKKGEKKYFAIELKARTQELNEVQVAGKTNAQVQREDPIKVEVLEVNKVVERAVSLPQIINQTAGVKIRESSGIGSNFEININGLQGNAIRFFRNGISTDYLGRANQLNLIPTGLISNVEIYKGVLPIDLGADALGGGINITTNAPNKKYVTATYEYGSFNTHIGTINANYNFPKSKFHIGMELHNSY